MVRFLSRMRRICDCRRSPRCMAATGALAMVLLVAWIGSCQAPPPRQPQQQQHQRNGAVTPPRALPPVADAAPLRPVDVVLPIATEMNGEPPLRVRVASWVGTVELGSRETLIIGPTLADRALTSAQRFDGPVSIRREQGRFLIHDATGRTVAWGLPALQIATASGNAIRMGGTASYPGAMVLVPRIDEITQTGDAFDVVNHVPLEQYLPGVLAKELYPAWHEEAYVAQAIAARSYALFERRLNIARHFDLESTTASQVYGGQVTSTKAHNAVQQTHGLILVHNGRVVPAFYSSCCGGTPQSSAAAFPHLGPGVDIPPLQGTPRQSFCEASTAYRWGPVQRDRNELAQRIAAWGKTNKHAVAELNGLTEVRIARLSASGRPAAFALRDARGRQFEMAAEPFRFACNHATAGLPDLPRDQQMRSSHVQVRVVGNNVHFTDGRGFGHGVGMCQWGAQGMARQGYHGRAIAEHYYPGAMVQKVY